MKITSMVLCTALALACMPAAATTYSFVQTGFSDGAMVSGTFTATDTDGNGQLTSITGEISDFVLHFSDNSLVPAFSLGLPDLFVFVAGLDGSGLIGDGGGPSAEAIGVDGTLFGYLAGPGIVDFCGAGRPCAIVQEFGAGSDASSQLVQFQVVPLPGALLLLLSGVGAVLSIRRARQ